MTEHRFTPRLPDGSRLELRTVVTTVNKLAVGGCDRGYNSKQISADHDQLQRGEAWSATVTDLRSGVTYRVAGADCGLPNCYCDAIVILDS